MIDPMMNLIIMFINDKAQTYGSEAGRGREQGLRVGTLERRLTTLKPIQTFVVVLWFSIAQ